MTRGALHGARVPVAVGRVRSAATGVFGVVLLLLVAGCRERPPTGTAWVGVNVIDGRGGPVQRDMVVITRGSRIEAVLPREQYTHPDRTEEIAGEGLTVMPGLVDAHVHVARWTLPRFLAWGVTTVRDVHGTYDSVFALRAAQRAGTLAGPRLYVGGAMLDAPPTTYPDATPVTDESSGRKAVDRLAIDGADHVKLYTKVDPALFASIADEARTLKLPMTAHLGLTTARQAADFGVRALEHLSGVPEATVADPSALFAAHRAGFFAGWTAFERSWAVLDSAALAATARTLANRNVTLVPTLTLHDLFARLDDPAVQALPEFGDMPAAERAAWNLPDMLRRAGWTAADYPVFRAGRPRQDQFLREFIGAGGTVAAGTDAPNQLLVPGAALHRELALLVRVGLTPVEAIRAATFHGARLVGADSIGVVAQGKVADLVILGADPSLDIANTRAIRWVVQGGRRLAPDSLRQAWDK